MKTLPAMSRVVLVLLITCVVTFAPAQAGSGADSIVGVEKFGDEAVREFALKVNDELDAKQVNVAILARSGRAPPQP